MERDDVRRTQQLFEVDMPVLDTAVICQSQRIEDLDASTETFQVLRYECSDGTIADNADGCVRTVDTVVENGRDDVFGNGIGVGSVGIDDGDAHGGERLIVDVVRATGCCAYEADARAFEQGAIAACGRAHE